MFVFVYSSYHLKLSFPHLVILTTLQTPKTCLVVLGIRRTGYPWHYLKYAVPGYAWHYLKYSELFWIPKTILLKSSRNPHPPPPQKKRFLESKISNPKKPFDHPHHLKSGVHPGCGIVFELSPYSCVYCYTPLILFTQYYYFCCREPGLGFLCFLWWKFKFLGIF